MIEAIMAVLIAISAFMGGQTDAAGYAQLDAAIMQLHAQIVEEQTGATVQIPQTVHGGSVLIGQP